MTMSAAAAVTVVMVAVMVMAAAAASRQVLHQVGYLLVGGGAVLEDSTFEVECLTGQRVVQVYLHFLFANFYDTSVETLAFFVLQGNDSVFINMLVIEMSVDAEHFAVKVEYEVVVIVTISLVLRNRKVKTDSFF